MERTGEAEAAVAHFHQVLILGPQTEQAAQVLARGIRPPARIEGNAINAINEGATAHPNFQTAVFNVKTFDGSEELEDEIVQLSDNLGKSPSRWRGYWDFELLSNSNITLTLISRELFPTEGAGFQAIFSPDTEWLMIQREHFRSGPLLRGFFNLNESQNSDFNLSSIQPGGFLETDLTADATDWFGRAEYVYSVDVFAGEQTADRHAIQLSATGILTSLDPIYLYVSSSHADFADDGVNPDVTSLDGPLFGLGASRFFQTGRRYLVTYSLGADMERANTTGRDFRYSGVAAHGSVTLQFSPTWESIMDGGLGYRSYDEFTGDVSRDEIIYRIGNRLRYRWNLRWTTSFTAAYEKLSSENTEFETDRFETGIVNSWFF